jgi:hypothetical protein
MHLDLRLRDLPMPRIVGFRLDEAMQTLQRITSQNVAKAAHGSESKEFRNRKEEMKRRLLNSTGRGITFEQATAGVGRKRLLLSLYIEYSTRSDATWLPFFDNAIARSVLGETGVDWHAGLRRQATQLFFTHFEQLPALKELCGRLLEAYQVPISHASTATMIWQDQRSTIFATDGPQQIARAARANEALAELMERFAVPGDGCFSARLKESYLLVRLGSVEVGGGQKILQAVEAMRTSPYQAGVPLGAAALRIMTRRVLEFGGEWRGDWADWILRLGCDPALPAASEPFGKWWGCWHPTRTELDCAQRGVNRQTLEYFIQFLNESLNGTNGYEQFEARAGFLRWLDDTRKIIKFKLLLHSSAFHALPKAYRQQRHRVARIEGAAQGTSVIVMECTDGVWIVEGTHSFAIRAFRNNFPLPEMFSKHPSSYNYMDFTQGSMHRDTCTGIWKAHMGSWIPDLLWQMKYKLHVEWPWKVR